MPAWTWPGTAVFTTCRWRSWPTGPGEQAHTLTATSRRDELVEAAMDLFMQGMAAEMEAMFRAADDLEGLFWASPPDHPAGA